MVETKWHPLEASCAALNGIEILVGIPRFRHTNLKRVPWERSDIKADASIAEKRS